MKPSTLKDNERWLLSFYRHSEISGALFFGRLARSWKPGPIQRDMTYHFADESQHARYWTRALEELGSSPVKIASAYQDLYLEAAGLPTNVMEVLAITQVFEVRVIGQYLAHSKVAELDPVIVDTIKTIMKDEKWHIFWVGKALKDFEAEYGKEQVAATIARYRKADEEVYQKTIEEHEERLRDVLTARKFLERDIHEIEREVVEMIDAQKVKETLARLTRKPLEKVRDDALMTELVSDSFALVEVVIELQEDLGVRLVSEHLKGVKTVADFARVVTERSAAQAAAPGPK